MWSSKKIAEEMEDNPLKVITLGVLFMVFLVILVGGIFQAIRILTLPANTATEVSEKTMDADNVIHNYEWFIETKDKVEAYEQQILQAQAALKNLERSLEGSPRSAWGFDDKQEWNRLNTVVLGLQNQRSSLVAEYNAKSKMENRALFKDKNLPEKLQ